MTRVQRHLRFPERWQRTKPVRVWGSLTTSWRPGETIVRDNVRSFKTREAATEAGGTLLHLWFDGCVRFKRSPSGRGKGRQIRGFLTQWNVA